MYIHKIMEMGGGKLPLWQEQKTQLLFSNIFGYLFPDSLDMVWEVRKVSDTLNNFAATSVYLS